MQMRAELDWSDTVLEIETEGELDEALDRVVRESDPMLPYVANLSRGDAIMSISETRDWAIVSFAFENGDEPFHVSLGDGRATGTVEVLFAGEWTEQARWSCIEPALARGAMRHFLRTGGLSPRVQWAPSVVWSLIDFGV